MPRGPALRRNARAALAALALPAPHAAALAPVAELMTEQDAAYLWSGGPPRRTDRPGGWREYYFSSDVAGCALPAAGNDANPCTPDAACLTTARMLALAAPGAHFILDDRDAWNTSTTFTSTFVLDQAAIGCPASPDEVCVWFSTTAADSAVETVAFGKPAGSTRSCMNVLSDGTDGCPWPASCCPLRK